MKRTSVAAVIVAGLLATGAWAADSSDYGIADFMAHKPAFAFHGGQTLEINGARIYYETYGGGRPVLVLHGGTAFLETMHRQIAALGKDHLVIAPDSRAHGRSSDSPAALHYHQMAEDMIGLMDRLHLTKVDVVGWSDGGIIGLDLAIHHPDRVGRVVVMGANYDVAGLANGGAARPADAPELDALRTSYGRLSGMPDQWPTFYGKVVQMWRSEPHYSPAELSQIRSPVLVIAGEQDSIRRDHTDALATIIPNAKEVIIPGATHYAPLTHSEAVNAAILGFLD